MKLSFVGVGLLALTSTIGFAQAAPQQAPAPMQRHAVTENYRRGANINQRRAFQQHRIAQGVRSGRLNARQANRLERREVSIGRQAHHMRRMDGGRLTPRNRRVLNHRLNRTSHAINRAQRGERRQ